MLNQTMDITGYGGEIELTAQLMLQAGLALIDTYPEAHFDVDVKNLSGACEVLRKELTPDQKEISKWSPLQGGVIGNLKRIKLWGYDGWLDKINEQCKDRMFLFDGTLESIPKRDPKAKTNDRLVKEFLDVADKQSRRLVPVDN